MHDVYSLASMDGTLLFLSGHVRLDDQIHGGRCDG